MDLPEKFMRKVTKLLDGCWIWTGSRDRKQYGFYWDGNRSHKAHRYSLEVTNGIKLGKRHSLHKCDNPPCVNPKHLFVGNNFVNQQDCVLKGRNKNAVKTHCPKGHPYTGENVYIRSDRYGERGCKQCRRDSCNKSRLLHGRADRR